MTMTRRKLLASGVLGAGVVQGVRSLPTDASVPPQTRPFGAGRVTVVAGTVRESSAHGLQLETETGNVDVRLTGSTHLATAFAGGVPRDADVAIEGAWAGPTFVASAVAQLLVQRAGTVDAVRADGLEVGGDVLLFDDETKLVEEHGDLAPVAPSDFAAGSEITAWGWRQPEGRAIRLARVQPAHSH